ncbi:MAG: quinol:cytochrome C oxidoreductase [Bacteroidia bacterium]|nr:quinol:cytochrome C oxidoreductase [Bacteroidia bacterium]
MNYYTFSGKTKNFTFALMGIGVIALLYGLFDGQISGARFWANILLEGLFFSFIAIGAVFFMSIQYAAQAGWSVAVKRVYEAIGTFMPFGILAIFVVLLASMIGGMAGHNDIVYRWMQKGTTDPTSPVFDEMVQKKAIWLNIPFVLIRTIVVTSVWIYMGMVMRKRSIEMDLTSDYIPLHYKNMMTAAVFIVFFGITEQFMAWDWVMAIDYNWHSTLFGWYLLDDMWLTAVVVTILLTLYLKRKGLLQNVNSDHIHNLGLWMFALSVLWTYLWFWQFMLYWYTNIPDEVVFFQPRIEHYRWLFWIMMMVNLLFPLIGLMTRDTKRNPMFLAIIGSVIMVTHWIDAYIWVMPGSVGTGWHIGFLEVGLLAGFAGLFIFVVLSSLAKAPLEIKNHPYLEESLHHHF